MKHENISPSFPNIYSNPPIPIVYFVSHEPGVMAWQSSAYVERPVYGHARPIILQGKVLVYGTVYIDMRRMPYLRHQTSLLRTGLVRFCWHVLTRIPWISSHMSSKMWDEFSSVVAINPDQLMFLTKSLNRYKEVFASTRYSGKYVQERSWCPN